MLQLETQQTIEKPHASPSSTTEILEASRFIQKQQLEDGATDILHTHDDQQDMTDNKPNKQTHNHGGPHKEQTTTAPLPPTTAQHHPTVTTHI